MINTMGQDYWELSTLLYHMHNRLAELEELRVQSSGLSYGATRNRGRAIITEFHYAVGYANAHLIGIKDRFFFHHGLHYQVEEPNSEFRGAMNDQIPLLNQESQEAYEQLTQLYDHAVIIRDSSD